MILIYMDGIITLKKLIGCFVIIVALTGALSQPSLAGESPFGWIYTTDIHLKGKKEFEQWIETQRGQSKGDYTNILLRSEFEYGVTDNYQIALYLNQRYVNAYRNGIDGTTGGPDVDAPNGFDPMSRYKKLRFDSVSMENLYRISNPYTDPVGMAVYFEPSMGHEDGSWNRSSSFRKTFWTTV